MMKQGVIAKGLLSSSSFELMVTVEEIIKMEPDLAKAKAFYESRGCAVREERMELDPSTIATMKQLHGKDRDIPTSISIWYITVPFSDSD
jgi:hypothetical protein